MRRSNTRILVLIFLLAVAVRLLAVITRPMVQLDEAVYARLAENLAVGNGAVDLTGAVSAHFSPLFPLITAAVSLVLGDAVLSGYGVAVLFGSLITIPTYLFGRELFGARTGLMAAALVAVVPLLVDYSSRLYSENIYILFLLTGLYFTWLMLARLRLRYAIAAGLALGVAYLANPAPFLYIPALAALGLLVGIKKGQFLKMLGTVAVFAGVFLVLGIPNILFIHNVTGEWSYTGKKAHEHIFAVTHNLRYGTAEWEQQAMALTDDGRESWVVRTEDSQDIISFFIRQPLTAIKMFANQSMLFYSQQLAAVIPLWLLPLLGLGLFGRVWKQGRAPAVGYTLAMLTPALVVLAMYPTDRFFMPFLPPLLILVALGWQRLEDWGSETASLCFLPAHRDHWRRRINWLVGAVVMVPVLVFALGNVAGQRYDTQYREAGEWIKANDGAGKNIMSRWEATSPYYAGGVSIPLPYAEYDRLTVYARSKGVDYFVIGSQAIRDFRPDLARFLEAGSGHPEWRLVHSVRPGTGSEVLIFRLTN